MDASRDKLTLHEWRQRLPYGEYLQPIRLTVKGESAVSLTAPESGSPVAKPVANGVNSTGEARKDGDAPSTPKRPKRRSKPTSSPGGTPSRPSSTESNVVVLPPFESGATPGTAKHMVLNVGGPVWAMDWLPSTGTIVASEKAEPATKSKKRKQPVGRRKKGTKGARGKENAAENSGDKDATNNGKQVNGSKQEDNTPDTPVEWRFLALSTHPPCEVQDGAVVRTTPPDHNYDVQDAGPGLIQIWAVPVVAPGNERIRQRQVNLTPRLVFGIAHDSGVAWEMQWSPIVAKMPKRIQDLDLLGVLAVNFGDGSLCVFGVPQIPPDRLSTSPFDANGSSATCIERLRPLVTARLPGVLQLSLQWSPRQWNLLLTGGSDGEVTCISSKL